MAIIDNISFDDTKCYCECPKFTDIEIKEEFLYWPTYCNDLRKKTFLNRVFKISFNELVRHYRHPTMGYRASRSIRIYDAGKAFKLYIGMKNGSIIDDELLLEGDGDGTT